MANRGKGTVYFVLKKTDHIIKKSGDFIPQPTSLVSPMSPSISLHLICVFLHDNNGLGGTAEREGRHSSVCYQHHFSPNHFFTHLLSARFGNYNEEGKIIKHL